MLDVRIVKMVNVEFSREPLLHCVDCNCQRAHMTARSHFIKTIAARLLFTQKESRAQNGVCASLPGGHHIGEPHAAQVLGHLTVDLLNVVAAVGNQHLLHD